MESSRKARLLRGSLIVLIALVVGMLLIPDPDRPTALGRALMNIESVAFWVALPVGVVGLILRIVGLRPERE